jgi:hypothetical protein
MPTDYVTDPDLLAELNSAPPLPDEDYVTDPALLAELNGPDPVPASPAPAQDYVQDPEILAQLEPENEFYRKAAGAKTLMRTEQLRGDLTKRMQDAKLFPSFASAASGAADKSIRRSEGGQLDLPAMAPTGDSAVMNAISGWAINVFGQKTGARLDDTGPGVDKDAIRGVFESFKKDNEDLSDEQLFSVWDDLVNRYRTFDSNEMFRVQSDGAIELNPMSVDILDTESAIKAINESGASEVAKEMSIADLPNIQKRVAENKAEAFEAASIALGRKSFSDFAQERDGFGPEKLPETVRAYEKEVVGGEGMFKKAVIVAQNDLLIQGFGKVAQTGLGIAGMVGIKSAAEMAGESGEAMSLISQGSVDAGLVGSVLKEVPSLAVQVLVTRGAGMAASGTRAAGAIATGTAYATAGLQSAGLTFADEYQAALDANMSEEEAGAIARTKAARAGISTAIITAAFGVGKLGGVEAAAAGRTAAGTTLRDLWGMAGEKGLKATLKSPGFREFAKDTMLATLGEASEEGIDQMTEALINADPDTNLADAWDQAIKAGLIGGVIGNVVHLGASAVTRAQAIDLEMQAREAGAGEVADAARDAGEPVAILSPEEWAEIDAEETARILAEERASVEEAGDETGPEWISGRGLEKAAEARKTELQQKRDGEVRILTSQEMQELEGLESAMPDGADPDLATLADMYDKKVKSKKEGKPEVVETPKTEAPATASPEAAKQAGQVIPIYHGTPNPDLTLESLEPREGGTDALGMGIYVTDDQSLAEHHGKGGQVLSGFATVKNTWTMGTAMNPEARSAVKQAMLDNGYTEELAEQHLDNAETNKGASIYLKGSVFTDAMRKGGYDSVREGKALVLFDKSQLSAAPPKTDASTTLAPETPTGLQLLDVSGRRDLENRVEGMADEEGPYSKTRGRLERLKKTHSEIRKELLDDELTPGEKRSLELELAETENSLRRLAGEPEIDISGVTPEAQAKSDAYKAKRVAEIQAKLDKGQGITVQDRKDWGIAGQDADALPTTEATKEATPAASQPVEEQGGKKDTTADTDWDGKTVFIPGYDKANAAGGFEVRVSTDPSRRPEGAAKNDTVYEVTDYTGRPAYMTATELQDQEATVLPTPEKKDLPTVQIIPRPKPAEVETPTTEATKEGTPEAPDSAQTVEGQGDEKDTTGVTEGVDAGDDVATIKQDEPSTDKGDTGERSTGAAQGDRQQASSDAQRALLGSESKPSEGVGQREVDAREGAARTLQAGGGDGTKLGRGNMGDQGGGGLGADRDVGGTVQEARQARKQVRDEALETAKGAWEDILNAGKGELPYRSGGGKYLVSQSAKPGVMLQITRTNAEGDPIGDEEIRTEEDFNRVLADQEYIDAALLRVRPDVGQAVGMASSIPKAEVPYHYQYRLRLRDVAPGTAPKGFISSSGRDVTYDRPLTKQELYDFEMEPVGAVKAPAPKESLPTDTPAPEEGAGGVRKAGVAQWFPATKVLPSDQRDELNLQRKLGDLFALKDRLGELKTEKAKSKLLRDNGGWKSEAEIDAAVDFHRGLLKDLGVTVAPEPPPSAPDSETSQETPTTSFPDKSGAMRTIKFPNDLSSWERGKKWAKDNLKTWSGTVGFAKDVSPEFDKAESMRQRATGKIKDLLFGKTSASRPSRDLQFWVGVHDAAQQVTKAESDKKAAPTPESPPPSSQETGAATSPQGATAPAIEDYLAIEDLTEGARYAAEQTKAKAERTGSRQYLVTRVDGYHIVEDAGSDRVLAVAEPTSESPPPASPEPTQPPVKEYSLKALQETFDLTEEQAVVADSLIRAMGIDTAKLRLSREDPKGAKLKQGTKGAAEFAKDGTIILRGLQSPDFTTAVHELAHAARRNMDAVLTPEEVKTVEDWAQEGKGWDRKAEERWARGWEKYFTDGIAPLPKLKAIFDKIAKWMQEVYKNVQGSAIDVEISEEVRKIFDKLASRMEQTLPPEMLGKVGSEQDTAQTPPVGPPVSENAPTAEPEPEEETFGVTMSDFAKANNARKRMGLPPISPNKMGTDQQAMDEAFARLTKDPLASIKVLARVEKESQEKDAAGKRLDINPLNTVEIALVLIESSKREMAQAKAHRKWRAAEAAGDPTGTEAAYSEFLTADEAMAKIGVALALSNSAWGRTGRAMQMRLDEDYSLAGMRRKFVDHVTKGKVDENGKKDSSLTPEQERTFAKYAEEMQELEARAHALEEARVAAEDGNEELAKKIVEQQALIEQLQKEVEVAARNGLAKTDNAARRRRLMHAKLDPPAEAARARLREKGFGQGPTLLMQDADVLYQDADPTGDLAAIIAARLVEEDLDLADATVEMIREFGEGIADHVEQAYGMAKQLLADTRTGVEGEGHQSAEAILASLGQDIDLTKQDVWDLARAHVIAGKRGSDVLDAVTDDLQPLYEGLTRDDVATLFTDYGKVSYPDPGEIPQTLNRLRLLERAALKLIDTAKTLAALSRGAAEVVGLMPKRTGFQRGVMDESSPEAKKQLAKIRQDEKRVRKEMREIEDKMREEGIEVPDDGRRLKTQLEATKRRMANEIEEIEQALTPPLTPRVRVTRGGVTFDEDATKLRAELERLREDYREAFKTETTEEQKIQTAIKGLDRRIAEVKQMLNDGTPSRAKAEPVTSPEIEERRETLKELNQKRKELRDALDGKKELSPEELAREAASKVAGRWIDKLSKAQSDTITWPKRAEVNPMSDLIAAHIKSPVADFEAQAAALGATPEQAQSLKKLAETERSHIELVKQARVAKAVTPEQRAAIAEKSLDRRIAEEESMLKEGILTRPKNEPITSPALEAKRNRLAELRQRRRDLYEAAHPGETALAQATAATLRAIARMGEMLRTGDVAARRREQVTPDEHLESLLEVRNALADEVAERRRALPKTPAQERAEVERALRQSEATLAKLEAKLAAGDLSVKTTLPTLAASNPAVQKVRNHIKELNKELDRQRREAKVGPYSMVVRLERYIRDMAKRREMLKERVRTGNTSPLRKKTEPLRQKEARDAKYAYEDAKKEFNEMVFEETLKNMGTRERFLRNTQDIFFQLGRMIMTSFDVGAIGRQGFLVALNNPKNVLSNFTKAFKSFSEEYAKRIENDIQNHEHYHLFTEAGLSITSWRPGFKLEQQEEEHRSRLARNLPVIGPGVQASERSYVTYLNAIRMTYADMLYKSMEGRGVMTEAGLKELMNHINNMTGRGSLGKFETSAGAISDYLFSVKYWSSRLRFLGNLTWRPLDFVTGGAISKMTMKSERLAAQKIISREYAKSALGYAAFYSLLAIGRTFLTDDEDEPLYDIGSDPQSSDFGKLVFKNGTRVDVGAGVLQNAVFLSRAGKLIFGEGGSGFNNLGHTSGRMLRSKLSPSVGVLWNLATKEVFLGDPVYTEKELVGMYVPLSLVEFYEGMAHLGFAKGTAAGVAAFLGFGTSTYGPGTKDVDAIEDLIVGEYSPIKATSNGILFFFDREVQPNRYMLPPEVGFTRKK